MPVPIQVDGYQELQRDIRRAVDRDLPKRIGQAHKKVGAFAISKIPKGDPRAVGSGAGATVRPSATKREVILRVGGSHRETRMQQWGKQQVRPFRSGRPYIIKNVLRHQDQIERIFMDEVLAALRPAFAD